MNFNKIKNICEQKGLPISTLADKIGISEAGIYLSFRNKSMKVDILEKIAKVLEVPIWVFFDLDPESEIASLKKEIEEYRVKLTLQENSISNLTKESRDLDFMLLLTKRLNDIQQLLIDSYKKPTMNDNEQKNYEKINELIKIFIAAANGENFDLAEVRKLSSSIEDITKEDKEKIESK